MDAGEKPKEWSLMSSGRSAFWLGCASFALLFFIGALPWAGVVGLGAVALGIVSAMGRGRKHGTSNPVLGICGLLLGVLFGAMAIMVLFSRMSMAARAPQAQSARETLRVSGLRGAGDEPAIFRAWPEKPIRRAGG